LSRSPNNINKISNTTTHQQNQGEFGIASVPDTQEAASATGTVFEAVEDFKLSLLSLAADLTPFVPFTDNLLLPGPADAVPFDFGPTTFFELSGLFGLWSLATSSPPYFF
jgi:hypothetical protein